MYQHPFLNNEDIPKYIPVQALTTIPNFKTTGKEDAGPSSIRVKSDTKLKAEDFGKKKMDLNINTNGANKVQLDGMHSPRNVFNSEITDKAK